MFILLLNPTSGPEGTQNQQGKNKVEDPESALKPLFANSLDRPDQAGEIRPCDDPDKARIEHTLIRAMERAAGQLFDRQVDPSPEMLMKDLEQYTHEPITPKRKQAFEQFFKLIRDEKPDVKSHEQEYLGSLIATWDLGEIAFRFTGIINPQTESRENRVDRDAELPELQGVRPQVDKSNQAEGIAPYHPDGEKEGIKRTLIFAMTRAAGQGPHLGLREFSLQELAAWTEKYTGQKLTEERVQALGEFFNALKEQKPDVKAHPEEFFNALTETWNNGKFEGLPELQGVRPRIDNDVEELKKKGIEVLDGGVDPIAGAKITLRINGKEYTASYAPLGGVSLDSLKSKDGSPVNPDVIRLVKENNELITRVGMQVANKHGWTEG